MDEPRRRTEPIGSRTKATSARSVAVVSVMGARSTMAAYLAQTAEEASPLDACDTTALEAVPAPRSRAAAVWRRASFVDLDADAAATGLPEAAAPASPLAVLAPLLPEPPDEEPVCGSCLARLCGPFGSWRRAAALAGREGAGAAGKARRTSAVRADASCEPQRRCSAREKVQGETRWGERPWPRGEWAQQRAAAAARSRSGSARVARGRGAHLARLRRPEGPPQSHRAWCVAHPSAGRKLAARVRRAGVRTRLTKRCHVSRHAAAPQRPRPRNDSESAHTDRHTGAPRGLAREQAASQHRNNGWSGKSTQSDLRAGGLPSQRQPPTSVPMHAAAPWGGCEPWQGVTGPALFRPRCPGLRCSGNADQMPAPLQANHIRSLCVPTPHKAAARRRCGGVTAEHAARCPDPCTQTLASYWRSQPWCMISIHREPPIIRWDGGGDARGALRGTAGR